MREPFFEDLIDKIDGATFVGIGLPTLIECSIVLSAKLQRDARGLLARLMDECAIATIPMTDVHYGIALDAWLAFGKGRHRAALNFGDCLAYATARAADRPLLCVGEDFPLTDLELA